jgi:hypothetical protein
MGRLTLTALADRVAAVATAAAAMAEHAARGAARAELRAMPDAELHRLYYSTMAAPAEPMPPNLTTAELARRYRSTP